MQRQLLADLQAWKQQKERKPVLVDGARQVGKSYLVHTLFGSQSFNRVVTIDFLAQPQLSDLFSGSLDPDVLIRNIEITFGIIFEPTEDLLFFDEIGECQNALTSLKFFAEQKQHYFIAASGSNLGLLKSFPVGKVEWLTLRPMCFDEFLLACGNTRLYEAYQQLDRTLTVHHLLWSCLLDYYYVGGMPEAVSVWVAEDKGPIQSRIKAVNSIHQQLISGYVKDFGKYSGATNALHIETVFRSVPKKLSNYVDDSVKRFTFKDVIEKKKSYVQLRGPINWLEATKLISKNYPIQCEPVVPLMALRSENLFKVFMFDVGLLGHLLGLTYADQLNQSWTYKGYLAENFVHNELVNQTNDVTYSWTERNAELEFILRDDAGNIFPVEVKSGNRTKAKSLKSYIERYGPEKTVKLIGSAGGTQASNHLTVPIYYASRLAELMSMSDREVPQT
ncbi:MAG TPA: AAA family ATPase [Oceanospirillaceae bacterium]|nr:AAA family ATPase [Oceanospirillaceae bacterium]